MTAQAKSAAPATQDLSGRRILLVEDEFLIRLDIQTLLEDAGAEVVDADTVASGLEMAGGPFDAAVLDVRLPDGEVFPIAETLAARDVPIVFHSAHVRPDDLMDRFPHALTVPKPCATDAITSALTRMLAMRGGAAPTVVARG